MFSGTLQMEKLHALLLEQEPQQQLVHFPEPLPLPLDPSVRVHGLVPAKAALFKSALMPCRLTFLTTATQEGKEGDGEYVAIFKHGDDLRQDQLILQTITLMDKVSSPFLLCSLGPPFPKENYELGVLVDSCWVKCKQNLSCGLPCPSFVCALPNTVLFLNWHYGTFALRLFQRSL